MLAIGIFMHFHATWQDAAKDGQTKDLSVITAKAKDSPRLSEQPLHLRRSRSRLLSLWHHCDSYRGGQRRPAFPCSPKPRAHISAGLL